MKLYSPVVVNLHSPREKVWGVVLAMNPSGVTIKGIDINSFDDWTRQVASGEEAIGLSTVFYPMHRVERVLLDEKVGGIPSLAETFQVRTRKSLRRYLNLGDLSDDASAILHFPAQSQGQVGKAPKKKPGR